MGRWRQGWAGWAHLAALLLLLSPKNWLSFGTVEKLMQNEIVNIPFFLCHNAPPHSAVGVLSAVLHLELLCSVQCAVLCADLC